MAPSRTGVVADSWPTSRRLIKPLVLALVVALSSMADSECYSTSPPNSSCKAHFPACAQFHAAAPFQGGATAPPGLDAQWSYLASAATRLHLRAAFRAADLRAAPSGTAAPSSSNHHSFAAAGCFQPTMLQAVLQNPLVNLFERFRSGASHRGQPPPLPPPPPPCFLVAGVGAAPIRVAHASRLQAHALCLLPGACAPSPSPSSPPPDRRRARVTRRSPARRPTRTPPSAA